MAKDDAVRNQKAFIRLSSVLELQRRYSQAVAEYERKRKDAVPGQVVDHVAPALMRKNTLEQVIELLELPIQTLGN